LAINGLDYGETSREFKSVERHAPHARHLIAPAVAVSHNPGLKNDLRESRVERNKTNRASSCIFVHCHPLALAERVALRLPRMKWVAPNSICARAFVVVMEWPLCYPGALRKRARTGATRGAKMRFLQWQARRGAEFSHFHALRQRARASAARPYCSVSR